MSLRAFTCAFCGCSGTTRKKKTRTCSPLCRARLREREHGPTKGALRKVYPAELVERVRKLYLDEGRTQDEIAQELGTTQKIIYGLMRNHDIPRRVQAKRDQAGARNHMWRGDAAKYQALHLRVEAARGKPSECSRCGETDPALRYEWANLTGRYEDTADYERMCVPCHRQFDAARRAATGERTSPVGRSA